MRIKSGRRKYSRVNLPSSDQNPMMYKLIFGWGNTIHNLWVAYICWKHRLNVRLCSVVLLAQGVVYLRISLRITHALSIYCPFLWRLISQLPLWHVFKPKALYWSQSASPHHPHPLPLFLLPSKSRFCVGLAGTWPTSVAQYGVYIKSRVLVDIYEKKHSFGNILVRSNKLLKSSPPPALWVFYWSCIIHRLQQLFSRCPRYLFQPENNQRRKCVQNKVMWLQWFSISGLWVHGNSISDSSLSSYDCFFFSRAVFPL